ncbi:hypothetical protein SD72_02075 [Leucobacter komagatae]|uniref:RpiR family transcriptional regulator n=1 Tax=Leucobacter komagatae TaxID=55969 RepID=A0A0D0IPV9_9MICO|nr:hypothetical protein SD72_02075 [Leucobacter komagatae]
MPGNQAAFAPTAQPSARARALRHALQPSEWQVLELVLARPEAAIEWSAQEVAARAGVGRTTVMRACQSLGYRGYPQLRVALASELGAQGLGAGFSVRPSAYVSSAAGTEVIGEPAGVLDEMQAEISGTVRALATLSSLLDPSITADAVQSIAGARRVLVVANGLSSPVASALSMRLTSHGRYAEFVADSLAQQIAARNLSERDVCVVVSGSGANDTTLGAAAAAASAGARVIAITAFAASALTEVADLSLVIAPAGATFLRELEQASRVSLMLFAEVLVHAVARTAGDSARDAHAQTLEVISRHLEDQAEA